MNEVIQNILNRRSVRAYSEEQISQEDLDLILKAGLFAPSACNSQSWHLTVVQNKEVMQTLSDETKKVMLKCGNDIFSKLSEHEIHNLFYNAPTIVVLSGEKSSLAPQTDCAAVAENMMLAAESLNIGSCWIGLLGFLFKSEEAEKYAKLLNVPEEYEPFYAIALGKKAQQNPEPLPRRENTVNYIR